MRSLRTTAAVVALALAAAPLSAQTDSTDPGSELPAQEEGLNAEVGAEEGLGLGDEPGSLTDRVFSGDSVEPPEWAAEDSVPEEGIVEDAMPDWAAEDTETAEDRTAEAGAAVFVGLSAGEILGAAVHTADDVRVGEVSDFTFDAEGRVAAVVFETGGFLGLGGQAYEVSVTRVEITGPDPGPVELRLDLFEADLGTLTAPSG